MKSSLIIPTWNEIDGCRAMMPRIDRSWVDEILVIDGGSTDGTVEWLREHGFNVVIQDRPGIGHAFRQAYGATSGDIIVVFSPDGNSVPEAIPVLVGNVKLGYDLVICSRYLGNARSLDDSRLTAFGNWLFTRTINFLFGGHYTDCLVIFRAYRRDLITRLPVDADGMTYDAQISIRAAKKRLKVLEIPGDEPRRIGGRSKMRPFGTGVEILKEIFKNVVR